MKKIISRILSFILFVEKQGCHIVIKIIGIKIKIKLEACLSKEEKQREIKAKYDEILTTVRYLSNQFDFDKELIDRIKYNGEHSPNEITYNEDKKDLQKHFDLTVKASEINPAHGKLRLHQERILDVVKEIVLPLEQEKIRCSMNGGFLIGALRHKGFIPWDDDADFDLVRNDYDKFIEYIKQKYVYLDTRECKNYIDFWNQMNKELMRNPNKIIFTDLKGYLQAYKGISISEHVTVDFIPWEYINPNVTIEKYAAWRKSFAKVLTNKKLTWGKISEIYRNEINTNKIFTTETSTCKICRNFGGYGILYPKIRPFLDINAFYPLKKMKFEDIELFAANDYEKYLALDFKDWKKIPVNINYAKFIKSISMTSKKMANKEFYVNYDDLIKELKDV